MTSPSPPTPLCHPILLLPREHKINIFVLTCNSLYIIWIKTHHRLSFGSFVYKLNLARRKMTSSISSPMRIWKIHHYGPGCTVAHICHGKTYFSMTKPTFPQQNLLIHGKTLKMTKNIDIFNSGSSWDKLERFCSQPRFQVSIPESKWRLLTMTMSSSRIISKRFS